MGCERYVKSLDGYTHLVVMLFDVFKHFDSLHELEIGMLAEANKLQNLGIYYMVRCSTLTEANKRRSKKSHGNALCVGVPMVVQLISAAKHDHYLLKEVHLPKNATLAMNRAYIDYAQFQRLTE